MANIMTKCGSLDNIVTYEHICDTENDLSNIDSTYTTLGSTAIVLNNKNSGLEVYMANSEKEWEPLLGSTGGSGSGGSSINIDATLSRSGYAADAKVVGNKINAISNNYVRYDSVVEKTEEEKATARRNIGAAGADQVAPAVDAYLSENFSNPSNPPLDRSLSSALSAAPADLVGELNDTINDALYSTTINTLNIILTNERYVDANGVTQRNSNSSYTNFIPVTGGATLTLSGVTLNAIKSVVAYSSPNSNALRKERLDDGSVQTGEFTTIVPEWARYIRATGAVDGIMTGTEIIKTSKFNEVISKIPNITESAMSESAFRAVLPYPMEMPAIPNIVVYATPLGYNTRETAEKYKLAVSGIVYVDDENGNDDNPGTKESPLKSITAALTKDANTIIIYGTGVYEEISINKDINIIAVDHITINGANITGNISVYFENITFDGTNLSNACSLIVSESTEKPLLCATNCIFENANANGLAIRGEASVRVFDCIGRKNKRDGFNYHKNTTITPQSGAPNVLEVRCEGYDNGAGNGNPTAENGSSADNYTQIIRVNCNYHNNHGGNIADTGNTKSWCIGCTAKYSERTDGNVNNADFWAYGGTTMYLENCKASGSTADIWAESTDATNTVVQYAGGSFIPSTFHTDSRSTITTFTRDVAVKYVL